MRSLTCMVLMLVLPCFPQTNDNERTAGGLNGRFWQRLNPSERLFFIVGLHEGLGITEFSESAKMRSYFPDVPYSDLRKGVDRFFEEPENLIFPVVYALETFSLKVNGATQSELDKKLVGYRQYIRAEAATKKK